MLRDSRKWWLSRDKAWQRFGELESDGSSLGSPFRGFSEVSQQVGKPNEGSSDQEALEELLAEVFRGLLLKAALHLKEQAVLQGFKAELLGSKAFPAIDGGEMDPQKIGQVLGAEAYLCSEGANFVSSHVSIIAYAKACARGFLLKYAKTGQKLRPMPWMRSGHGSSPIRYPGVGALGL